MATVPVSLPMALDLSAHLSLHLRADARAERTDREEAEAGGRPVPGERRARTDRFPPLPAESSSTSRGGGAARLRPSPSSTTAAAGTTLAAARNGDREEAAETDDAPAALLLLPAPEPARVERGVEALALAERGVAPVCRKEDGLMPGTERVDLGLRPRVDMGRGSSPKKPPTTSSSAPNVGVCSIGELAENMSGVSPVPRISRSELTTLAEFGTRFEPCPLLRAEAEPARAL